MKKVLSNSSAVIHVFAQRSQNEARCSNVFFNNPQEIYSYGHHYMLGKFLDDDTILIDDTGYSVTTSKHISEISYATRQYKQFFRTKTDLKHVYNEVIFNKNSLGNARKPEKYIQPILSLFDSLNEFIKYSKDKETKKTSEYKEIKRIVKALSEDPGNYKEKVKILAIKQAKVKKREDAKRVKETLTKFNEYKINSFRIGNEDYLRLSIDGKRVETSQQISIKTENARNLYELIKRGVDIRGKQIENYTITSINGTLKIGCHNINIDSVHKIGKLITKLI